MSGSDDFDPYDRTSAPLRQVAIFAVGIGISLGLCSVGVGGHGLGTVEILGVLIFVISVIGFGVSVVWLVVAFLIKTFQDE